jgi:hypothetical protein
LFSVGRAERGGDGVRLESAGSILRFAVMRKIEGTEGSAKINLEMLMLGLIKD